MKTLEELAILILAIIFAITISVTVFLTLGFLVSRVLYWMGCTEITTVSTAILLYVGHLINEFVAVIIVGGNKT
jgi:hypothetical protein